MPSGIVPDEGADNILLRILDPAGRGGVAAWRLILWVNDFHPDFASVLADLVPATFGGYSFVTLFPATWTTPEVDAGCAESTYGTTPLIWNVTGGPVETPYGFALVDTGAGVIRFVQRFDDADIVPAPVGSKVVLLPRYSHTSAACSMGALAARRRRAKKARKR